MLLNGINISLTDNLVTMTTCLRETIIWFEAQGHHWFAGTSQLM